MDFSIAWQKFYQIGRDLMAALPNMVFGIVVFVLFVLLASGVRAGVRRVTSNRQRNHSLTLLLSPLPPWRPARSTKAVPAGGSSLALPTAPPGPSP